MLNDFNGRTWSASTPNIDGHALERIVVSGEPVAYTVTLEATRQQWLFALDIPYAWSLPGTSMGNQQQLSRVHPIDQRVAYDAVSYTRYRSDVELGSRMRSWYLDWAEGSNPRTAALARQMYAAAGSKAAFVEAVLQKFHEQEYFYTLRPPALGRDPVDQFLFSTRQGFCEHYASAFALMMRVAGIPTRIVLGYQGGELNPVGNYLIVRQADAHAWTEVWLEGQGWRRVDPTAAVAPERIDAGMSASMFGAAGAAWGLSAPSQFLHQLGLSWDAINAKWNDWVLGYGPENQDKLMQWLGMDDPDWQKMMLTLIGLSIALIIGISLLLTLRYRAPPQDRAAILYRSFVQKTGLARPSARRRWPLRPGRARRRASMPPRSTPSRTATWPRATARPDPGSLLRLRRELRQLHQ